MQKPVMDSAAIKEHLPHREPFLFLDGVTSLVKEQIEAYHDVRAEEFYFPGHFPGNPVMPGVIMIEAIAQAGILLALTMYEERRGRNTLFAGINDVRFKRVVRPGDRLILRARVDGRKAGVYKISGEALVGDELACSARIIGALR
jgi:beta-hydroxyacyl-ACP dehydratase FabZ